MPCASLHGMQLPPHISVPALHAMPQVDPLQVAVPIGSVGQGVQLAPHEAAALFDRQAAPQVWKAPVHSHWWLLGLHVRFEAAPQSPSAAQPLLHMPLPRSQ